MSNLRDKFLGSFFSITVWFGFVIMLVTWLENNTQLLVGLVPDEYAGLVGYGIGILIWFFRWITIKPVEQKSPRYEKPKHFNPMDDALREDSYLNDY